MARPERLAEAIKREVSAIILQKLADPRIGFVSLTEVELTADLRQAKVFVSVLGTKEEQEKSLQGLNNAANFIREELKERIQVRYLPSLRFIYDPSIERGARVSHLINELSHEKDITKNKKTN